MIGYWLSKKLIVEKFYKFLLYIKSKKKYLQISIEILFSPFAGEIGGSLRVL